MQKYKITASKSQKKYTLIISASSDEEAREKVHKEGYSILSSSEASDDKIIWQKFIFQAERDGEIKNGIIIGKDIFKVYLKLRDELWYNIIALYPEWDKAHTNSEKKQKILDQLEKGYELQKWKEHLKKIKWENNEKFYLRKEINEVSTLIESVIKKLDVIMIDSKKYNISEEKLWKLQQLHSKLIHLKSSTNLTKLKKIWEIALMKVWEIELQSVEVTKNKESWKLLSETNSLLKKIWSDQRFIEKDKDIKSKIYKSIDELKGAFSLSDFKKNFIRKKEKKEIDTESYGFLKTVLLLEKHKEKLKENTQEIRKNLGLIMNPFSSSEKKEKIFLTRRVIKQNISILRAKKTGSLGSYTGVKKWYHKITEEVFSLIHYFQSILFIWILVYSFLFGISQILGLTGGNLFSINTESVGIFILFFWLFIALLVSKNIFTGFLGVVFFLFLFIFSQVNF